MSPLNYYSDRIRLEPCGCRVDAPTGTATHFCPGHEPFEVDIDKLRQENDRLRDRAASLENAAQAMGRLCTLRRSGFCLIDCVGQMLCDLTDLKMLPYHDLPEQFKELLCGS